MFGAERPIEAAGVPALLDATNTIDSQAAPETRLLAMAPDLLGAAGFDGLLRLVNPAWTTALGWSSDQLLSRPYLELVVADDRDVARNAFDRVAAGEAIHGLACRMLGPDGRERCILWSAHGVPGDDCFYLAGKDITERKRLEDELAVRAEKLERTNAELQDFAYIASHDLAEPLRMITSYLELLQRRYEGQLDDTADEFIGYAVGGAVRLKALIDDLLTYSRVGTHDITRVDVDLGELLDAVLLGIERAVTDAGAVIERSEPPAPLPGDPAQMAQLLQNLLLNAVKFHARDQAPRVRVSCVEEGEGVRLSVADDGIGISAQHHERIFKMFARLHGRDEYEGTGVGLAVCRRIADRHGGRIWLESAPDAGSVFHVWLPR